MHVVRAPPGASQASQRHQTPRGACCTHKHRTWHACALPTVAYTKIVAASATGKQSQQTSVFFSSFSLFAMVRGVRNVYHRAKFGQCTKATASSCTKTEKKNEKPPPTRGCSSVGEVLLLAFFFSLCTHSPLSHARHIGMHEKSMNTPRQYKHLHAHTLHIKPMRSHLLALFTRLITTH